MKRRRVKITGIGPVTPAGIGREEFWNGILEPVSRIRPFTKLGEENGPVVAAYLEHFKASEYIHRTLPSGVARHTAFAVVAAALALADAGLEATAFRQVPTAAVVGCGYMDFGGVVSSLDAVAEKGAGAAHRRAPYNTDIGGIPAMVSATLELGARTLGVSNQCVAGLDAIGQAAEMVATGEVEIALCGGTDAPLHRFPLLELRSAGLTPPAYEWPERICRPFDRWRTTGVISEGAAMFVLEPEESPRPGYAYVRGYAFANDKLHDPCGGLAEAVRHAVADARLHPWEIEAVSAWGPGHTIIDRGESQALATVFGAGLRDLPVVSIKGAVGSPVAAAPAIQVAAAALGLRDGALPPTVNWQFPDPECPLNLGNTARYIEHRTVLVDGHGLSGVNSAMVLERC